MAGRGKYHELLMAGVAKKVHSVMEADVLSDLELRTEAKRCGRGGGLGAAMMACLGGQRGAGAGGFLRGCARRDGSPAARVRTPLQGRGARAGAAHAARG